MRLSFSISQGEHVTYRPKPLSEGFRRHSTDGTGIAPESPMAGEERRFHPYCRQYSEGTPPLCLSPFACLQEEEKPRSRNQVSSSSSSPPPTHGEGEQSPWPLSGLAPQASMFLVRLPCLCYAFTKHRPAVVLTSPRFSHFEGDVRWVNWFDEC